MKSKTNTKKVSIGRKLQEDSVMQGESSLPWNPEDFIVLKGLSFPCLYCYTGPMSIFQEMHLNEKPKKTNQKARKSNSTKKV